DDCFAMSQTLLLNNEGKKMGKTAKGAVWLDPEKTSPYDFYQYWRNVDDADVEKCLALLTFLPMDEVRRLGALRDSAINEAKRTLAFEVTKLIHGEEEAQKARESAEALFSGGGQASAAPTTTVTKEHLDTDKRLITLMVKAGLCKSNGDARKQIEQGAVTIGEEKVTDPNFAVSAEMLEGEGLLVRKGKKSYHRFILG
ncbi:MAG: tyrosine--tRNA ligase, partial [Clostridia bacterium]|nr:tyrosine--tRNA ligase [Clostridia bacterium]